MSSRPEYELFKRAKEGDCVAFDRLQKKLELPIRRFIRRLVGGSAFEDDIVQDAFLALYTNLGRIDPIENLRPFLFRIVRNLCYDELRRRGRFQSVTPDEDIDDADAPLTIFVDNRPLPDEELYSILLYSEVKEAIERLPELQRQALILYCEEDLSYEQIAEAMATDIGTIKSRIHYARKNLVKILSPDALEALGIREEKVYGKGIRKQR